jgi:acetyl esterase/lipase
MPDTITYIHDKPESFLSKILKFVMATIGMKKGIRKVIETNNYKREPSPLPKSLATNFEIREATYSNRAVWTIRPKKNTTNKVVLYIHGGGYISNIIKQQWDLIEVLINKTNSTIIIPDYKLAPDATYKETYEFILNVYNQILKKTNAEDLIIMGDSAGGGFALGFVMTLRDNNQTQPSQIILLSPWLDISMQNPEIQEIDKYDKMLSIDGLQIAGKLFAGNLDIKDYRVSPIYGDFKNLSRITLFIGTHDLFIADSRKMKATLDSLNIPFNYFEYPKMFHVWMAVKDLKEAKKATQQLSDLINQK